MGVRADAERPRARKRSGAYHHGNLRQAAIEAALDLIREAGGPHFSLREVSLRLGVGHSALYRHFHDRQALLIAVATEGFRLFDASQRAALEAAGQQGLARLQALCRNLVDFALSRPADYRAMFSQAIGGRNVVDDALHAAARPTLDALVAVVEQCQAEGMIPSGDPAAGSAMIWSMMHGFAVLSLDGQIGNLMGADRPNLTGLATRIVIDGLGSLKAL